MATRARYRIYGLQPDKTYELQLAAVVNGIRGPKSARFTFRTTIDNVAPGPVRNLDLDYIDGQLILSWDAPTENEDGTPVTDLWLYFVEVTDNSTGETNEFDTTDTRVEFSFQFLRWLFGGELSGDYTFTVFAADKAGNRSEPADISFAATPPGPFNMLAWVGGNQSITVTWEESEDIDLTHYEIYRDGQLVGRTVGTETEFTDGNPGSGEHEYYAIAYDAFGLNTQSTNTLTGAKAFGYWQGDTSVPKPPQNLTFNSVVSSADGSGVTVEVSFIAPIENQDLSEYEDHNEFLLQWSKSLSGPWQSIRIPDTRVDGTVPEAFTVALNDLAASTVYHFRAAAIDRYSNISDYALDSHTTAQDEDAPSQPAVPTAAGKLLRVQVSHNMQKQGGGILEDDVRELKVYIDTSSSFTPSEANYVGSISTLRPSSGFKPTGSFNVPSVAHTYVKVIAVDASGNESVPSAHANSSSIELISDAYIENLGVTDASILNLSADKMVANSSFINDLFIESTLTINANGYIESNYDATAGTGYRLSTEGLFIYDGIVAASALTINNSPNLIPWAYSSFEVQPTWFFGGTDVGGNAVAGQAIRNAAASTSVIAVDGWEGERSLNFKSTAAGAEILFTPNTSQYKIPVVAGQRYVYSMYVKTAVAYNLTFVARWGGSATSESVQSLTVASTSGQWVRKHVVFTAPAGATGMYMGVRTTGSTTNLFIDALQVELVTSSVADSLLEPSAWKSPTMTTIDGGMIRTGEIVSTNYDANNGWRIGLEGNFTAYNAFLRGTVQATGGYLQNLSVYQTLTVGNAANDTTSRVQSYNGSWLLRGDGYLEASNANIAGTITAYAGSFANVNAYSVYVGGPGGSGFIQSVNYNGNAAPTDPSHTGSTGWLIRSGTSGYSAVFNNIYARGNIEATNLSASAVVSGDRVQGGTITGAVLQTRDWGKRLYINMDGISFYPSTSGTPATISSDANNRIHIAGWLNVGEGAYFGQGLDVGGTIATTGGIDANGSSFFGPNGDTTSTTVYSYGATSTYNLSVRNVVLGTLNMNGNNISSVGSMGVQNVTVGNVLYGSNGGRLYVGNILMMQNQSINDVSVIYYNHGWIGKAPNSSDLFVRGNTGTALKLASNELRALDFNDSGYVPMRASAHPTSTSDRRKKGNIQPLPSMLDVVRGAPVYRYQHKVGLNPKAKKLEPTVYTGLMVQDLPDELVYHGEDEDDKALDAYTLVSALWKAVQELDAKVERMAARLS